MARGISENREPFPYVLEEDRGLPESEQTCWWLIPYGLMDTSKMERRFARSEMVKGGKRDIDVTMRDSANMETFLEFVHHIDNYFFHGDKKGTDVNEYDVELKKRVFRTMKSAWGTELLEVATGAATVDLAEKKPSNSVHTSKSGGTTTTK